MNASSVTETAEKARSCALKLAHLNTDIKNQALEAMACAIESDSTLILEANRLDLEFANQQGIAKALISRLTLNENKIRGMAQGVRSVANLSDPVGSKLSVMEMDDDLLLYQITCPIGVIGAIFESRPDAVPQISSLCLKSGNAVILKGGTEAQNSNRVLVTVMNEAIAKIDGVPANAIQMIETRAEVAEMLQEEKNINLIVPRGSNDFVKYIQENTRIPVLGHSEGICHCYIDDQADIQKAVKVVLDSKLQYPAACNAMETLLIHQGIADKVLPILHEKFCDEQVELVGCEKVCQIVPKIPLADVSAWDTEYSDLKLSIKVVPDLSAAVAFINAHGSGHTDSILTENRERAETFLREVDSASVLWNASTRFADGFRYGLGAEIGISTNKTHARGPVGLQGLVIYKYQLIGDGQTVAEYSGDQARQFTHKPLSPDNNSSNH
jgi:glutamate-5-semialdehyde dehydrogenase